MSKTIILLICSIILCCTTKNSKNQQTNSIKSPKQATETKKPSPPKLENEKEPKIVDNYSLEFYGEISVSSFLTGRWGDFEDRDSLNYEDVAKYFRYEHPDQIRSLELHSLDTNQFVFFSPYIMDYQPSIEYFTKDSLVHSKSERYHNSFPYLSDSLKKKYTYFMRTQIHKNNQFLAAFEKSTKQGILFIYRKHDHYFKKVNINCFIADNFSDGYAQENNNFSNYNLQQEIYFDAFSNYVFLTVDGFETIFVYDFEEQKTLICRNIEKVLVHPTFIGLTNSEGIVFYDKYDYTFKIINSDSEMLYQFKATHPEDLKDITYCFDEHTNELYMSGFEMETMKQKIFKKRIKTEHNN